MNKQGLDLFIILLTIAAAFAVTQVGGYIQFILGLVALTTLVGIGLNILYGLTGLVSLGQIAFFSIGAYAAAILTINGLSFWLAVPIAVLMAALSGALLAIPAARMAGPFLAMTTIAFAFIVEHIAIEWESLTGGQNGLIGVPMPIFAGLQFAERELVLLCVGLTGLGLLAYRRLAASGLGLAMMAIRDTEIAASALGYHPFKVKLIAFVLAAAFAGLAGALFAPLMMFIAPSNFPFSQSILYLFAVLIGGAGTTLGPLVGALVIVFLPEFLSDLAEYRLLFFGGLLVVVLLAAPKGLVGTIAGLFKRQEPAPKSLSEAAIRDFLGQNTGQNVLSVTDLGIAFGGVQAAAHVSLDMRAGEVTSIIGPNGAGKTTILNIISGFYQPDQGTIHLDGRDLAGQPAFAAARAGIARTYQTPRLFENLSVAANIVAGLPRGGLSGRLDPALSSARLDLAAGLLAFCGYDGNLHKRAGDLPHVDRRLVEIARALALKAQILLLDEPAAGLMRADKDEVAKLLRRLADCGLAVVLVEHDMDVVMGISDTILVLDAGEPIALGAPATIQSNPAVIRAYLGDGGHVGRARATTLAKQPTPVLAMHEITAGYGAAPVLKSLSLQVNAGEMVALLGANGAGKSTCMAVLAGLNRASSGTIELNGHEIQQLPAHAIVGQGLILVPEGRQVFPELSVLENIELGAYSRPGLERSADIERHLARFPRLRQRLHNRAGLLSGGEQQMLAIARGLMAKPRILLLDEPSLGLAPAVIDELYTILAELRDDGITILLVDQMAYLALKIADRAYVLEQGQIVAEGLADELARDSQLIAAYLGGANKNVDEVQQRLPGSS